VQPADNDTDTAALLRELSSLGLEDEPSAPAATQSAPRPSVSAVSARKKKSMFGR